MLNETLADHEKEIQELQQEARECKRINHAQNETDAELQDTINEMKNNTKGKRVPNSFFKYFCFPFGPGSEPLKKSLTLEGHLK